MAQLEVNSPFLILCLQYSGLVYPDSSYLLRMALELRKCATSKNSNIGSIVLTFDKG